MWVLPAVPITAAKAVARGQVGPRGAIAKKPTSTSTRKSSQPQPPPNPPQQKQQQQQQQQQQPVEIEPCCVAQGHTDWVHSVALSPSGDLAASGADDDSLRLWRVSVEPPQLQCVARLPTFSGCFGCAVAPGSKEVFSSSLDIRRSSAAAAAAAAAHSTPCSLLLAATATAAAAASAAGSFSCCFSGSTCSRGSTEPRRLLLHQVGRRGSGSSAEA